MVLLEDSFLHLFREYLLVICFRIHSWRYLNSPTVVPTWICKYLCPLKLNLEIWMCGLLISNTCTLFWGSSICKSKWVQHLENSPGLRHHCKYLNTIQVGPHRSQHMPKRIFQVGSTSRGYVDGGDWKFHVAWDSCRNRRKKKVLIYPGNSEDLIFCI